jgi:DNA-binding MarR family transcriptional regulator
MNRKEKISEVLEGLRQVMAPLWHATRAYIQEIVSENYGITASQFHTLRRIEMGRSSVTELADCLHVSQPNISRAVDELVQKGYVSRERMDADRRRLELSLTPQAKKLFKDIHLEIGELFQDDFELITDAEIDHLSKAIEILQRIVTHQAKENHS